ncbi:hypothetical protein C8R43DRAFT_949044 [Mycena crocata]|nr:hypothetical protein C8R43DRAFT_949044 [Mycena crocata]
MWPGFPTLSSWARKLYTRVGPFPPREATQTGNEVSASPLSLTILPPKDPEDTPPPRFLITKGRRYTVPAISARSHPPYRATVSSGPSGNLRPPQKVKRTTKDCKGRNGTKATAWAKIVQDNGYATHAAPEHTAPMTTAAPRTRSNSKTSTTTPAPVASGPTLATPADVASTGYPDKPGGKGKTPLNAFHFSKKPVANTYTGSSTAKEKPRTSTSTTSTRSSNSFGVLSALEEDPTLNNDEDELTIDEQVARELIGADQLDAAFEAERASQDITIASDTPSPALSSASSSASATGKVVKDKGKGKATTSTHTDVMKELARKLAGRPFHHVPVPVVTPSSSSVPWSAAVVAAMGKEAAEPTTTATPATAAPQAESTSPFLSPVPPQLESRDDTLPSARVPSATTLASTPIPTASISTPSPTHCRTLKLCSCGCNPLCPVCASYPTIIPVAPVVAPAAPAAPIIAPTSTPAAPVIAPITAPAAPAIVPPAGAVAGGLIAPAAVLAGAAPAAAQGGLAPAAPPPLMPVPAGGFPQVHGWNAKNMFTNVSDRTNIAWTGLMGDKILVYEFDGSHPLVVPPPANFFERAKNTIARHFACPAPLMCPAEPAVDPTHLHEPPYIHVLNNLAQNNLQALIDRQFWSFPDVSFFAMRFPPPTTTFVCTLDGLLFENTQEDAVAVATTVAITIRDDPKTQSFLTRVHDNYPRRNLPTLAEAPVWPGTSPPSHPPPTSTSIMSGWQPSTTWSSTRQCTTLANLSSLPSTALAACPSATPLAVACSPTSLASMADRLQALQWHPTSPPPPLCLPPSTIVPVQAEEEAGMYPAAAEAVGEAVVEIVDVPMDEASELRPEYIHTA